MISMFFSFIGGAIIGGLISYSIGENRGIDKMAVWLLLHHDINVSKLMSEGETNARPISGIPRKK